VEGAEEAFAQKDAGFVRETGPSFFKKAEKSGTALAAKKD
jgi:hypothetical protein